MSLTSAASSGDRLETLKELRDELAGRMEICTSDQNFSVMAARLADTLSAIATIESENRGSGGTVIDEVARRRAAAGRPDATSATRATRSS